MAIPASRARARFVFVSFLCFTLLPFPFLFFVGFRHRKLRRSCISVPETHENLIGVEFPLRKLRFPRQRTFASGEHRREVVDKMIAPDDPVFPELGVNGVELCQFIEDSHRRFLRHPGFRQQIFPVLRLVAMIEEAR